MPGPIDTAYVEILPDLKNFDKTANKELKSALKDVGKELDKATQGMADSLKKSAADTGKAMGEALGDGGKLGADKFTRDAAGRLRDSRSKFVKLGEEIGESLGEGLKRDVNGRLRDSRGRFAKDSSGLGGAVGRGFLGGLGSALDGAQGIGKQISGAMSAAGPYIQAAAIGMAAVTAVAVGPAVVALGAAIPAAAGVAGAAIGTLALGFHGLGDAIDDMGDPEKFAEALEKLSPAARNLAVEIKGLVPAFRAIKDAAQEGLFKGFQGQLTSFITTIKGPLSAGLFTVGQSLQHFVKEMLDLGKSPVGIETLNQVFETTGRIIDKLTPSFQIFAAGILDLVRSALPFVEKLSEGFGTFLEEIGQKLGVLAEDGTLGKFFHDTLADLKDLKTIAESVGGALSGIFKALGDDNKSTLENLKDMAKAMDEFFNDPDVIWALSTAFAALKLIVGLVQFEIKALLWLVKNIGDAFRAAKEWVEKTAKSIGDFGSKVKTSITDAFNSAKKSVTDWFTSVGTWFEELPGKIGAWLSALPGVVAGAFVSALHAALFALGVGIGLLIFAVTELPGQILSALQALPGILAEFFVRLWNSVATWTTDAWNNDIYPFLAAIPGQIWSALSSLPGILGDFFTGLWADVRQWAVDGWNSVISWISGVPGRIAGLTGRFTSAGQGIIRGFFNGLASAWGYAGSVGAAVYGAFKSGLNWAIGAINSGIASVDDVLPGSLPRIPYLASGGVVGGPTVAMVGEAGDEMVLPLSGSRGRKAMDMIAQAAAGNAGAPGADGADGVRVWGNEAAVSEPMTLILQSDGSKLADLLLEILSKAVRVRGGNVQKVLGTTAGGVA